MTSGRMESERDDTATDSGKGVQLAAQDSMGIELAELSERTPEKDVEGSMQQDNTCYWFSPGCLARPFTFSLHLAISIPLYLITLIPILFVMAFRAILLILGLSSPPPEPTEKQPGVPRIFFDGAGYCFYFALGVMKKLREDYDVVDKAEIFAISAGNIAAICFLLDKDPEELLSEHYPILRQRMLFSHFREPVFGFCNRLRPVADLLDDLLPDNIHHLANGRYHAMICSWPLLGIKYISNFRTKQEFIDAVVCSMGLPGFICLPLLSFHAGWRGLWVDGGLQHIITPVEPMMDLTIRTFADPLKRHRNVDLLPPDDWKLRPAAHLIPPTFDSVIQGVNDSAAYAAEHPALAALEPYRKKELRV
eukprot:CAMPEP_0181309706 /NCGR_PEP_ID=MMETSP1101-20121128/12161_1 /TAXON_ID=46948 /ORGANISM="Rhodomonas abbreviata, Strain Caron Lab Isolate" /LENGTH=363 /DNA_ID=CAMNT_0023416217 /DNA_START=19 /DNA_END=1110 /DNA_ORIENTATION=-